VGPLHPGRGRVKYKSDNREVKKTRNLDKEWERKEGHLIIETMCFDGSKDFFSSSSFLFHLCQAVIALNTGLESKKALVLRLSQPQPSISKQ